ncbi:DUF6895 family protein [Streptomyces sp. NPDC059496]|uniref:DUF6895 family protein n=1 Tax=Streptomyces sp. NPDC059496 TaxID=3346851 RepID=UPI0036BA972E
MLTEDLPEETGAIALSDLALGSHNGTFPSSVSDVQRLRLLGHASASLAEVETNSATIREAWCGSQETGSVLSEQRLVDRLVDVLRLAHQHVSRLAEYRAHWADVEDPFVSLADKVAVESAILALVADRCAGDRALVRQWVGRLARSLEPHVRSSRNEIVIRRYPHTAMSLGIGHAALSSIGLPDPDFDRLVRQSLDKELADCTERLPYRAMERRWLSGLLGVAAKPQFDDLLPLSIAARPGHPIYMLATDVYALTHAPMFMTDFGRLPVEDDFPYGRCEESLDATAAWVLHTDNFDLMGELVLARVLLNTPWTTSHFLAWKTLEVAWDRLGFLACPSFAIQQFHELPAEERSSYAFRHIYHTTYVAGILCAALLRAPSEDLHVRAPTPVMDDSLRDECRMAFEASMSFCAGGLDGSRIDVAELAQVAGLRLQEPPLKAVRRLVSAWHSRNPGSSATVLSVLDHVDLPDGSLASSLADGLLTCSARAYDLSALAQTLQVVVGTGLPVTTTVAAAARFLIRQQLPNGTIGGWFLESESTSASRAAEVTAALAAPLGALSLYPE